MAVLDLLTLVFSVLAVVMNAAAVFVLLKKKSGKAAPLHSLVFASFSFIFLMIGCAGYLLSSYAVVLPVTAFLSGACMALYFATERETLAQASAPLEGDDALDIDFPDRDFSEDVFQETDDEELDAEDFGIPLTVSSILDEPDDELFAQNEEEDLLEPDDELFAQNEEEDLLEPDDELFAQNEEESLLEPDDELFAQNEEESLLEAGRELVASVSEVMSGGINLDALLDIANQSLMRNTGADGGIIFLVDNYEDILNARAFSGQFPPPYRLPDDTPRKEKAVEVTLRHAQLPLEGNIFGEAALSGEALCIMDGEADGRVFSNGDEDFLKAGSYIIAPLSVRDEVIGVAGLARLSKNEPFSQRDFRAAKALALYAAAVVNNAYSYQAIMESVELESGVEMATRIQETFQPKKLPELPEVGFGFFSEGAKGVCADYCDVIFARRDRVALVMADVAGKGIVSGMIMTALRALLHLVTNTTKSAATILEWVNKGITDKSLGIDHYATVSYVSYSPETNELEYACAGNQPMLLWRAAEKRMETVRLESVTLGIDRSTEYKEIKLTAAPGDIIMLFTDGVVEALDGKGGQYGIAGLSRVVSENEAASARELAAAIRHDIKDFTGSVTLHDDQTLLVMKVKNP